MSLGDDLKAGVRGIFESTWSVRDGEKIPAPEDIQLGNRAVRLDATVLYADLSESTDLVATNTALFAAEIYKTFLYCAAKIIRSEGGVITSYDGDRVMGAFIGTAKNTSAASSGLKINYAVNEIINPALMKQHPKMAYEVRQVVGVDSSEIHAARTGIRGSNDIVWVGRAANYAAKLSNQDKRGTWITEAVFSVLDKGTKYGGSDEKLMWSREHWPERGIYVYHSSWQRSV